MKKHSCDIVQDLLPLYVDGDVSQGSREFVENHLKECEECGKEYRYMCQNLEIEKPAEYPDSGFAKMKKRYLMRVIKGIGAGILAAAVLFAGISAYLLGPAFRGFQVFDENSLETEMEGNQLLLIPESRAENRQLQVLYETTEEQKLILYLSFGGVKEQYRDALRRDPVKETYRWSLVPFEITGNEEDSLVEGGTYTDTGLAGSDLLFDDMEAIRLPENTEAVYYLDNISDQELNSWRAQLQDAIHKMSEQGETGIIPMAEIHLDFADTGKLIWKKE
ncbi:MAG: zf-HC2 domain-containing protein [Lachnospiraceae bacterium]|nr:zf-HC2 domain-containing protein [Lachnospiraceae bacterium]